ncbi:hypothetical protein QJS10_CPA16g01733 [Acorus calamus]|uniref:Coenzyme Q-binding protein COQ10 START domain-containing protein n=1 Tax=Acorus calamus TaxID=4465 RepID=A0AAV9D2E3_ACOCL|nr:hypothetical protein QJS10_CPA16g01733 [Acorus calamus]
MSVATAALVSGSSSLGHFKRSPKNGVFLYRTLFTGGERGTFKTFQSDLFLRSSSGSMRNRVSTKSRPFSPVMEWQDCTTEMEIDVPCSVAYACYSDRESIPKWMPFISSVKILKDKPDLSRWALKYEAFGQDIEFSWLARNMQPTPNQKIHWRSLEGLPNRGAVRFFPKGPSSCKIQLTVSYEVPQILTPVASALKPFLSGLLLRGLERFSVYAKESQSKVSKS